MAGLRLLLAGLLLSWAAASAAAAPAPARGGGCDGPLTLALADRSLVSDGSRQDGTVALPDTLTVTDRSDSTRQVYRLDVSACANHPAAELWIFRAGAPYTVHDDSGQPLELLSARSLMRPQVLLGSLASGRPDLWNGRIPSLFALRPGTREVTLSLLAPPYLPTGLVRADIGPTQTLVRQQAHALEQVVAYSDAGSGVMLVLGLLAGLLGLQRRRLDGLLWLSLACILWGVRGLAYYDHAVHGAPLAFEQFNPLNVLLAGVAVAMGVLSLLGLADRITRIGLGLTTLACSGLLVSSTVVERGALLARALAFGSTYLILAVVLVLILRARRRLPTWHGPVLALALAGLLACAGHDMLVVAGSLPPTSQTYVFWGFIALMVSFAAITGHYVVQTLGRAEQANAELERAIAAKTSQLEASYALLRDAERERVQTQAREHLLREMHDGIGAQLMTTLRGLERAALSPEQVRNALQDGLDELRLLMDSGDIGRTLAGALAAWRHRWDPRLDAVGLALDWQVEPALEQVLLEPEAVLQVMRILQEAVTNVVKHARARRVRVLVSHAPVQQRLLLEVGDDGVGLPSDGSGGGRVRGRGLANMQTRAQVLGGQLAVQRQPTGGSVVRLQMPAAAAEAVRS